MRKIFLLLAITGIVYSVAAQETYDARVVILFSDTIRTKMTVDLHAPNNEMITCVTTEKSKSKSKGSRTRVTSTTTSKLNAGIITCFFIDGIRYKFKDLNNDYADSTVRRNCAVQRIAGSDTLGIFEFREKDGSKSWYIQTPSDIGYRTYNIEHPYLTESLIAYAGMRFYKCASLYEKLNTKLPGYYYEKTGTTRQEKLDVWKNIIAEYYKNCSVQP